jgi:hypothetical protein
MQDVDAKIDAVRANGSVQSDDELWDLLLSLPAKSTFVAPLQFGHDRFQFSA